MQTEDNLGGSFILTSATNRKKERKKNLFTISGGANREDPPVPFAHPSVAHPRDLAGGGASRAGKFTAARRKIHRRARTNAYPPATQQELASRRAASRGGRRPAPSSPRLARVASDAAENSAADGRFPFLSDPLPPATTCHWLHGSRLPPGARHLTLPLTTGRPARTWPATGGFQTNHRR